MHDPVHDPSGPVPSGGSPQSAWQEDLHRTMRHQPHKTSVREGRHSSAPRRTDTRSRRGSGRRRHPRGAPTNAMLCTAARLPVFWQFVGFGDIGGKQFDFLHKLDDLPAPASPRRGQRGLLPRRLLIPRPLRRRALRAPHFRVPLLADSCASGRGIEVKEWDAQPAASPLLDSPGRDLRIYDAGAARPPGRAGDGRYAHFRVLAHFANFRKLTHHLHRRTSSRRARA